MPFAWFLFIWIYVLQARSVVSSKLPTTLEYNVPTAEYTALFDLYNATDGGGWLWRNETFGQHWNFTSPDNNPCVQHWQGLNCTLVPEMGTYLITRIDLNAYHLVGTLPPSIGNFAYLGALSLAKNSIVGTLPAELQQLRYLEELDIFSNGFSGSLPSLLGSFPLLKYLALGVNAFTGTIPPELASLHNLEILIMGNNPLHGSIPAQLGSLQKLRVLDMYHTGISGTIPSSLGNMTQMRSFNLYNNSLEGPIPSSFGDLQQLRSITLGLNKLTGTLPSTLGVLSNLEYIDFLGNQLTGTIPDSWGTLNALHILYLDENKLEGTVDVLCQMDNITQVYFEQNQLSGTVPACLGSKLLLSELYFNSNDLTGPLPDTFDQLRNLLYLELDDNFISSTIPASFGRIPQLNKLFLSGNLLEGTLPSTVSNLSQLALLQLQYNFLSGPISGVFNATTQPLLQGVLLSRNRFTGSIPLEPFQSRRFMQFSAVDNCLQGSVPEEICNCRSLRMLALDGIGTARTCVQPALPGISSSYLIKHPLPGGIPTCLFQLPNITTLHLSGNGLTGSLPYELEIGDTLIDLALSHNTLAGRIPRAIQERTWYSLDLSYNRFNGELLSSFNTETVTVEINRTLLQRLHLHRAYATDEAGLSLNNNRLSGNIPATLQSVQDLHILDGNLFGCNWDQSNLPPHDSARDGYQCGSNSFNAQYYAWLIITGLVLIVGGGIWRWRTVLESESRRLKALLTMLQSWYDAPNLPELEGSLKNFHYTDRVASAVNIVALRCTFIVTFILAPLYIGLSHKYATVKFQYAWLVSAMFQSGVTPFAVLFVALILLMAAVIATVKYQVYKDQQREALSAKEEGSRASDHRERLESVLTEATPGQIYAAYATFFVTSFVLVIGVNLAFVYIVLYANNSLLFFAQIFLSFFKGFWNSVGSVMVMRWAFNTLAGTTANADYHSTLLFASLMNNIAIPCLVIAMISPDCFYNLFVAPPSVEYTYVYLQCAIFIRDHCLVFDPRLAVMSFVPPFTYSYQCAAQYVMSYAPTFVYLAIEVAFLLPLMQALRSQRFLLARRNTRWHAFLAYTTPQILQLVDETAASETKRDKLYLCYDANLYLVQLITYLGIMLTFGVVFPPLAVAMLVAIASLTLVNRLIVGRYILSAVKHNALHLVDNIEKDCRGVGVRQLRKLRTGAWMLIAFSCFFYALFLFDILGDDVGLHRAYWVLLLVPLMTAALFVGEEVRLRMMARGSQPGSGQDAQNEEQIEYELPLPPRDIEMMKSPALRPAGEAADAVSEDGSNDVHNTLHL